jgi:2-phospho-L-lactate guanylyltransferase
MVGDVLEALGAVRGLDGIVVVGSAEDLPKAGIEEVAGTLRGRRARGRSRWNRAIIRGGSRGSGRPWARGGERVPARARRTCRVDPGRGRALLASAAARRSDRARPPRARAPTPLLIDPPEPARPPAFGPGSFARHAALAHAGGATVRVERLPSLELDVDTPGDLAALRAALAAGRGAAPRTRALLERLVHAA